MRPGQQRHQSSSNGQAKGRVQKPKADFVWKPKFTNTLPDLPYDGKFLQCPFVPLSRFIEYRETDLERNFKKQAMSDIDVGVNINIVDPDAYIINHGVPIHEKDQQLLDDESASSLMKLKRSAQHSRVVPFMRRTEYISSEFNRFGAGADRQETKVGYNLFKNMDPSEMIYRDRASQIAAINKTFEDVKKPVTKHYSKPGVTAVEELEIFPDFDLWKYPFAQVIFDADPSYSGVPENLQKVAMENSMLSGLEGSDVGYFCPTVETIQKILEEREDDPDDVYEFPLNREYTWVVRNKTSKNFEDDYVLYRRGDKFVYNELETRVKLNRKRRPAGVPKLKAEMHLTYREPNEAEEAYMDQRMRKLMNEEDSDDEDEEMESDAEKDQKSEDDKGKQSSDDENDKKGSGDDKKSSSSDSKTSSSDSDSD